MEATTELRVFYTTSNNIPKLSASPPTTSPPALPCTLHYHAEGGANILFRLTSTTTLPSRLQNRLLRLRKNLPHTLPASDQLEAFTTTFLPLFPPTNIIHHDLIELDPTLPPLLNETLARIPRPQNRRDTFLPLHERHGVLVTDMSPRGDEVLIQLKPKWLAQSPDAPPGSRRCRTCALRAQRAARGVRTATDAQAVCPLALVSESVEARRRAVAGVTGDERARAYLVGEAQVLLRSLRRWQVEFDARGVLNTFDGEGVRELCKAMTLRDCTLFVRCERDGGVEARVGDLDLKAPGRMAKWRGVEEGLGREGWYWGGEVEGGGDEERVCLLALER
ncbi:hypothetical protein EJ03DRAFT_373545 [Teratosphaeria nubilosa]|uniref:Inositol-pentakisphosphate 2-kinase n=1 Tax=Teratosphaeria nubilosa TaxID=161662 RepID=A0A6G1LEU1_9PEZI|nr:hypothetical protein EJ03DRAFT_373545 [Teratosphaeria nubilosa]